MTTKHTNKGLPNNPAMFPPPATWMSWTRNSHVVPRLDAEGKEVKHMVTYTGGDPGQAPKQYERAVYDQEQENDGKVRHHYTRAETRKSLMWLGKDTKYRSEDQRGRFYVDWAVYEWVDGAWLLRGSGLQGELRRTNDFFAQKQTAAEREHPFDQALEAAAIESILKVAS